MVWLRLLLFAGSLGAIAISSATTPWEARLVQGNHTWILDLGRHPVWQPPVAPGYAEFRLHFEDSKGFPHPNGGWAIRSSCDPAVIVFAALAYCWPVALICGLQYRSVRGTRRDLILHCAVHVAVGLPAAIAACFVLWCIVVGWGPLAIEGFAVAGVVGGIISGLTSFPKRHVESGSVVSFTFL